MFGVQNLNSVIAKDFPRKVSKKNLLLKKVIR